MATTYWWDGVRFVKGTGVKYPHPDRTYYGIYSWETWEYSGTQLQHLQIDKYYSESIANMAPAVAGAVIGSIIGQGALGSIIGAILGLFLGSGFCKALLDEEDCIWVFGARQTGWVVLPVPPFLQYTMLYCRVGPYTLWNELGISNP